jgi:hypothetical protein
VFDPSWAQYFSNPRVYPERERRERIAISIFGKWSLRSKPAVDRQLGSPDLVCVRLSCGWVTFIVFTVLQLYAHNDPWIIIFYPSTTSTPWEGTDRRRSRLNTSMRDNTFRG